VSEADILVWQNEGSGGWLDITEVIQQEIQSFLKLLSTVANQAFSVVSPRIWNDLPADVTSAESLSTFRQRLKTHLFSKSFPGYFLDIK